MTFKDAWRRSKLGVVKEEVSKVEDGPFMDGWRRGWVYDLGVKCAVLERMECAAGSGQDDVKSW